MQPAGEFGQGGEKSKDTALILFLYLVSAFSWNLDEN